MNRFATTAIALASLATVASATTVNMSFTGGNSSASQVSVGSGSLSFTGSGPSIGLSDVTAFSFTATRDIPTWFTSTHEWSLADLLSLTGTIDSNGNIVELNFTTEMTDATSVSGSITVPFGFRAQGASYGGMFYETESDWITGTMTYSSVPTPGAIGVLAGAGLFAARRRR